MFFKSSFSNPDETLRGNTHTQIKLYHFLFYVCFRQKAANISRNYVYFGQMLLLERQTHNKFVYSALVNHFQLNTEPVRLHKWRWGSFLWIYCTLIAVCPKHKQRSLQQIVEKFPDTEHWSVKWEPSAGCLSAWVIIRQTAERHSRLI